MTIYTLSIKYYNIHALLLWICWTLFSIILVGSARWWKHHPKAMNFLHIVCGLTVIGLTIWLGLRACFHLQIKGMHWDVHSVSGIAILVSSLIPFFTGVIMMYMRQKLKWKTKLLLKVRSCHKMMGYLMIFTAQFGV